MGLFQCPPQKGKPFLCAAFFAVLLGGHAGDALEVAVEGGRLGEAEHIGSLLKSLCGTCLDEALGLCDHVLFYPFHWRDVCGSSDHFAEMLRGEAQQIGVELDLPRLPIMLDHQVAEAVEEFCITVLGPLPVLFAAVKIEKLIAYCQLRQQSLITVGHFFVGVIGDDDELVYNG